MGNDQGVIWNDSDFVIQYYVYGKFEQMKTARESTIIEPELTVDMEKGVCIKGFKKKFVTQSNFKYQQSTVEILAGRISSLGLGNFELDKNKVTVKAIIGDFEKVLCSNVIVKRIQDIRMKIRRDLSIKILEGKQFSQVMKKAEQITNPTALMQQEDKQRTDRRIKYIEQLKEKAKITTK